MVVQHASYNNLEGVHIWLFGTHEEITVKLYHVSTSLKYEWHGSLDLPLPPHQCADIHFVIIVDTELCFSLFSIQPVGVRWREETGLKAHNPCRE